MLSASILCSMYLGEPLTSSYYAQYLTSHPYYAQCISGSHYLTILCSVPSILCSVSDNTSILCSVSANLSEEPLPMLSTWQHYSQYLPIYLRETINLSIPCSVPGKHIQGANILYSVIAMGKRKTTSLSKERVIIKHPSVLKLLFILSLYLILHPTHTHTHTGSEPGTVVIVVLWWLYPKP